MPELPEVETVRRGLAPLVEGALITTVRLNRPDLRFPFPDDFAKSLTGARITSVGRRAKYLLFALDSGATLLSHLGMTGNYRFSDELLAAPSRYRQPIAAERHDHVVLELTGPEGTNRALIYSDPRRFGFMTLFTSPEACSFLKDLGPEPLGNAFSAPQLAARFRGRRAPVKSALLDQRNVAGLGNIYVSEALWRAGIAPTLSVGTLVADDGAAKPALEALVGAVRSVLEEAIAAGGSTLKDFRQSDGAPGYFQHNFDVYDRADAPCRRVGCNGTVTRMVQSGRASFYCPVCQAESG